MVCDMFQARLLMKKEGKKEKNADYSVAFPAMWSGGRRNDGSRWQHSLIDDDAARNAARWLRPGPRAGQAKSSAPTVSKRKKKEYRTHGSEEIKNRIVKKREHTILFNFCCRKCSR